MMSLSFSLLVFLSALFTASALTLPSSHQIQARDFYPPNITLVYQFPNNGSWIENLVQRPNGDLLVTRLDACQLYSINPRSNSASLVNTFPNCDAATGITEIAKDVFVVLTATVKLQPFSVIPGSYAAWLVDYGSCHSPSDAPRISQIASLTKTAFLNGLTTWTPEIVLATDSSLGLVWAIDVHTGDYSIAVKDPTMAPTPDAPLKLGINGIKVLRNRTQSYLYYTNSNTEIFHRLPVSSDAIPTPIGPAQALASGFSQDDFGLAKDGTAYIGGNAGDFVYELTPEGALSIIAGETNQLTVIGATSCVLGRTKWDKGILYVGTTGGLAEPINGVLVEPGKVVAIRLECNERESCVNSE